MKRVQFPFQSWATKPNVYDDKLDKIRKLGTNHRRFTGSLFSNCEFLNYLDYADSPSKSWYKMPIFSEVGLN
jgi:hypothetical protein